MYMVKVSRRQHIWVRSDVSAHEAEVVLCMEGNFPLS